MAEPVEIDWDSVRAKSGPYPDEAFAFVRAGLGHTVEMIHGGSGSSEEGRHVSGQQLCLGLRDYALQRYGMLARTVLSRWGVRRTQDFGRIVFGMIEAGLMRKSEEDRLEDFADVYDFDEAFAPAECA